MSDSPFNVRQISDLKAIKAYSENDLLAVQQGGIMHAGKVYDLYKYMLGLVKASDIPYTNSNITTTNLQDALDNLIKDDTNIKNDIADLQKWQTEHGTMDSEPKSGSMNAVTSNGLYNILGQISSTLDKINGESV